MAPPKQGSTHQMSAYYSIYQPRKDERLSWPSWLTYSGRFIHISGHPSATGQAQDRKVRRGITDVLPLCYAWPRKCRTCDTEPSNVFPISSDRQHLSYDVCLEVKGDYQNCSYSIQSHVYLDLCPAYI